MNVQDADVSLIPVIQDWLESGLCDKEVSEKLSNQADENSLVLPSSASDPS